MGGVIKSLENELSADEIAAINEDVLLTAKALHSMQASIKDEMEHLPRAFEPMVPDFYKTFATPLVGGKS